jgi:hypothetical protein
MYPLKQASSVHNTFPTPFIPSSVNMQNDTYQLPLAMSATPSTSVSSAAPLVPIIESTSVGPVVPVAVQN